MPGWQGSGKPMMRSVLKAALILTGALAVLGGGSCAAANLILMPNLLVIVISLLVAASGWALVTWGRSLWPAAPQEEGTPPSSDSRVDSK